MLLAILVGLSCHHAMPKPAKPLHLPQNRRKDDQHRKTKKRLLIHEIEEKIAKTQN
jgi:hypothetical protein